MVQDLFRDAKTTEFVIATIPTVLAINESRRLLAALRREEIPCTRIIVNQAWRCPRHSRCAMPSATSSISQTAGRGNSCPALQHPVERSCAQSH